MLAASRSLALQLCLLCVLPAAVRAQSVLERSPNVSGGWVGMPWMMVIDLPHRYVDTDDDGIDITSGSPTIGLGLGLPREMLAGAWFAPESEVVGRDSDEWAIFGRYAPLSQDRGEELDVGLQAGYNGAAQSVDGELSAARWFGPVRLLGAGRAMTSPYGDEKARFAVAGGVVIHPLPGRVPIALAGDVGTLLERKDGEEVAWSAGLQIGVSFTPYTFSLLATNTSTGTLEGVSRGGNRTRYGFELTLPVPLGRFLGWYVPREVAGEAVVVDPSAGGQTIRAGISKYAFSPMRIVIPVGTTIEWTNYDPALHTVSADDGSWDSGAIREGETWRARFDRPGRYPFHCGPHPFMKGIVVVR